MEEIRMLAKESLDYLGAKHCVLVCRGISDAPFTLKLFAKEFGVGIGALCVILTEEQRRSSLKTSGYVQSKALPCILQYKKTCG